jgi:ribosomal protein S18 acetylase RimI-like enzyme
VGHVSSGVTDPLDNPVWAALTSHHKDFADVLDGARRYPPDMSPFFAVDQLDADAWGSLGRLAGPQGAVLLARAEIPPAPEGWTALMSLPGHQMVATTLVAPAASPAGALRPLSRADVPAMLELIALARPGPFEVNTIELGRYCGVFDGDRLVAMAGERLHLPDHTEVSAVATHPEARQRGLGALLTHHVAAGIVARGETPILHVASSNEGARRVYERLGFTTRRLLAFRVLRPPIFRLAS